MAFTTPTDKPLNTTYDIETGCPVLADGVTPDDALLIRSYGPFDPSTVKLTVAVQEGGDEAIKEFLRKKEEEYLPELRSKSALNPMLAVVTAIVYNKTGKPEIVAVDPAKGVTEAHVLEDYWARWVAQKPGESIVGWNNFGFDDEMIIQRSIVNGVKIPENALHVNPSGSRRLKKSRDLAPELYGDPKIMKKLEEVSKSLGGPGKNGDGAYFSDLVRSGDPEKVRMGYDYLKNDEVMTRVVAGFMGVTDDPVPVKETGPELIVPPLTRQPVPMTITRQLPAIMPEGEDTTGGATPVLFGFVITPKGDDALVNIFGRFDPASVKVPKKHQKNEATIAAYIKKEELEHYAKLRKAGAGDGLNSVIRAAGYLTQGKLEVVVGAERDIVQDFWNRHQSAGPAGLAGYGCMAKEEDFVVMRSIANRVPIPAGAVKVTTGGYRSLANVRDLAVLLSGDPKEAYPLQQVAAAFDVHAPSSKEGDLPDLMRADPAAPESVRRLAEHLTDRLSVMAEAANHLISPAVELPAIGDPVRNLVLVSAVKPVDPQFRKVTGPSTPVEDDVPWDFPAKPAVTEDSLLRGKATLPPPAAAAPGKPTHGHDLD